MNKTPLLVSACLLGVNCKYDGGNNLKEEIIELAKKYELIPVCPEVLGGLDTPRIPSEIVYNYSDKTIKVINKEGANLTQNFEEGAKKALKLALMHKCKTAILKAKSPSCGCGLIYDGSFSGQLVAGNGITAELLLKNNIEIYNEKDFKGNL